LLLPSLFAIWHKAVNLFFRRVDILWGEQKNVCVQHRALGDQVAKVVLLEKYRSFPICQNTDEWSLHDRIPSFVSLVNHTSSIGICVDGYLGDGPSAYVGFWFVQTWGRREGKKWMHSFQIKKEHLAQN
jgi:hypothetical protein